MIESKEMSSSFADILTISLLFFEIGIQLLLRKNNWLHHIA